uniref:Uncharacterized protein n=1 Tax=Capra hircus TaxID=9925 RepID=A0A8C2S3S2_CAPHI
QRDPTGIGVPNPGRKESTFLLRTQVPPAPSLSVGQSREGHHLPGGHQRHKKRKRDGPFSGRVRFSEGGLTQKNLAKEFDFPIPLSETSKIMKKKNKKVLVWSGVYKVISKMLEENEKYRLRLKCQQLSRENSKDRK